MSPSWVQPGSLWVEVPQGQVVLDAGLECTHTARGSPVKQKHGCHLSHDWRWSISLSHPRLPGWEQEPLEPGLAQSRGTFELCFSLILPAWLRVQHRGGRKSSQSGMSSLAGGLSQPGSAGGRNAVRSGWVPFPCSLPTLRCLGWLPRLVSSPAMIPGH